MPIPVDTRLGPSCILPAPSMHNTGPVEHIGLRLNEESHSAGQSGGAY